MAITKIAWLLFAFLLLCRCSTPVLDEHCNCNYLGEHNIVSLPGSIDKYEEINLSWIEDSLKLKKSIINFGYHVIRTGQDYYFSFLDTARNINCVNLETRQSIVMPFPVRELKLDKQGNWGVSFADSSFHIVNYYSPRYYRFRLLPGGYGRITHNIDLRKTISPDGKTFINYAADRNWFRVSFPYLTVPYWSGKNKYFLDKFAFLRIDLSNHSVNKMVETPENMLDCFVRDFKLVFTYADSNTLFSVYSKNNILHKYNLKTGQSNEINIPYQPDFTHYDRNFENNFSYDRKYLLLDELNISLMADAEQNAIVVKREGRKQVSEKESYLFFVFDKFLQSCKTGRLPADIFEPAIFPYKNGFLVLSKKIDKGYYIQTVDHAR